MITFYIYTNVNLSILNLTKTPALYKMHILKNTFFLSIKEIFLIVSSNPDVVNDEKKILSYIF